MQNRKYRKGWRVSRPLAQSFPIHMIFRDEYQVKKFVNLRAKKVRGTKVNKKYWFKNLKFSYNKIIILLLDVQLIFKVKGKLEIDWTLREKCRNTEFLLVCIFLYSVRIQENTDQKKLCISALFTQWEIKLTHLLSNKKFPHWLYVLYQLTWPFPLSLDDHKQSFIGVLQNGCS